MISIINILILFFILLIMYQLFLAYFKSSVIEGMMDVVPTIAPTITPTISPVASPTNEMIPNLTINQVYRQYDKKIADNTFLLAQQNAGNIEYIKQRLDNVQGLNNQVQTLSNNFDTLQAQVNDLILAQKDYTSQMVGDTPPDITGATSDTPVDSSQLITE